MENLGGLHLLAIGWVEDEYKMNRSNDKDISDDVRMVRGYGNVNNRGIVEDKNDSLGVRPVVCIPIDNINENTLQIKAN